MSFIRNLKERVKLFLYSNKNIALRSLRFFSVITGIFALGLMVYYYGFPHSNTEKLKLVTYFKGLFGYYVVSYLIRLLYSLDIKSFITSSWHELVLLLLLSVDAIGYYFLDENILHAVFTALGSSDPESWYITFMQNIPFATRLF